MFCRISPLVLPITAIFVEAKLGFHNVTHLREWCIQNPLIGQFRIEVKQHSTKLLYQ